MPQTESLQTALERFSLSAREVNDRWAAYLQLAANGAWRRQAEQGYRANLDSAESWVERSLELQGQLLQEYRQALAATGGDRAPASGWFNWVEQARTRRAELWQRWFQAARQLELPATEDLLEEARGGQGIIAALEKLSQQALQQQAAWARTLFPQSTAGAAENDAANAAEPAPGIKRAASRPVVRAAEA